MPEVLQRDPMLLRLAARLLAKAERAAVAQGASRPIRLKLDERELPELYGQVHAESMGRVELLLREMAGTNWVRLLLGKERAFTSFAERKPQLELIDFDALAAWAGHVHRADRWPQRLAACMQDHWPDDHDSAKQALIDYLARNPLLALSTVAVEESMQCLLTLRAICLSGQCMALREVSARVFQGRSKILDTRDELLRLLGAHPGQFWEAPIQLLVDAPPEFDEALFVENLVTFEQMADTRGAAWRNSLLVYAAGFKGSARRLRQRKGCRVYLRTPWHQEDADGTALSGDAQAAAVGDWLFADGALPTRFFGDLDYAGLQILASLREVFPTATAWQPGYAELLNIVMSGGGHVPAAANKERQLDPGTTGCPYADNVLLPALRQAGRFVDQEVFGEAVPCEAGSIGRIQWDSDDP